MYSGLSHWPRLRHGCRGDWADRAERTGRGSMRNLRSHVVVKGPGGATEGAELRAPGSAPDDNLRASKHLPKRPPWLWTVDMSDLSRLAAVARLGRHLRESAISFE